MNKKSLLAILLAGMLALVAVGCGAETTGSGEATSVNQANSGETTKSQGTEDEAKKAEYFASVDWLKQNGKNVVILDARTEDKYKAGHIPGAINATWQGFANMKGNPGDAGWGTLLPVEQLSQKIGALGINGDKDVVVYANPTDWGEDGRLVWMFRMAGVSKARMLDGGFPAWKAGSGEVSTDVPAINGVDFKLAALNEELNTTTAWVKDKLGKVKILDVREKKEYEGATDYGEKRGGHIPGAINVNFNEVFKDDGTLKSLPELKDMFTKAGLNPEDTIVSYCTKGIRSAHATMVLRMLGYEKAENWDASFYEWAGNKELPLEK